LPSALADGKIIKLIGFSLISLILAKEIYPLTKLLLFMSFVKIWVHLVFSTKNREPLLTKEVRIKLHQHIIENAKEKGVFIISVNGYTDHLHCLISLGKEQTIAKVAMLIKGESAFWLNKQKIITSFFSWQDDYFAVSISESQVEKVKAYIINQEKHHAKKSFADEVDQFIIRYGWNGAKAI
jgi:putative transposase